MTQIVAQATAKKDLWAPVINWVDPEVVLRVKRIWDCRVLF